MPSLKDSSIDQSLPAADPFYWASRWVSGFPGGNIHQSSRLDSKFSINH
uniref:Uncharacterized protein n=1 Tax=Anguilla anguilla TaxID=7936 RepID=A0A0E9WHK5_ANGAN